MLNHKKIETVCTKRHRSQYKQQVNYNLFKTICKVLFEFFVNLNNYFSEV